MHRSSIIEQADEQAPTGSGEQELRARLHGMWSAVAPAWAEHAAFTDARHGAIARRMLELTAPRSGERVLELACGAGGLGLAAAELVAPDGEVVLSDVAPEMTAIAAQRAGERGIANVRTAVLDLERVEQPDAAYDVVLCREGLMFAPDPSRAAGEIARVLRPGGRLAVTVWGPREANPWLSIVFAAASARLGRPVPPPGIPGPFALEDGSRLAALFTAAGLAGVAVDEVEVPMRAGSFEEWWQRTSALAGPLAAILASLPQAARDGLADDVRSATEAYRTADGGLDFPGLTLLAGARRPV